MTRGIFIAGNESALGRALEAEAEKRVERFAVALIPNRLTGAFAAGTIKNSAGTNEKRLYLDWNPSSPISARTLILAAENRLDRIDEAILVCSPPSIRCVAEDLPLADVEILVNDHIKGWFFLVKELAAVFSSRKSGILSLVYHDVPAAKKDDAADILGPSALASFRALTQGLLAAAHNEHYTTVGFSCSDAGSEEAFSSFVFKSLDEVNKRSNGKLYRFGRLNLFR
jgi:NAD(P)-dependent dehydrogenase (short-subunit alcohol dehydrogenase family)